MAAGSKAVKSTALTTFKTNLLPCTFAGLIVIFVFFICNLIASLFSYAGLNIISAVFNYILLFFLFSPILYGFLRFCWRMILGVKDNCISVFYYFSNISLYKKIIKLQFVILYKGLLRGIVFFLPALFIKLISYEFFYKFFNISMPVWAGNLGPIFNGMITFGIVVLTFIMLKYYLAPMLIIADENMENEEAIHMSDIISKKSAIDFIYLCISFLGWFVASYFVFPLIFTIPYMCISYLYHSRFAITEYNKHIENSKNENKPFFAEGF